VRKQSGNECKPLREGPPPSSNGRVGFGNVRSYFAGHAQIKNAEGQDMAQIRAGVKQGLPFHSFSFQLNWSCFVHEITGSYTSKVLK